MQFSAHRMEAARAVLSPPPSRSGSPPDLTRRNPNDNSLHSTSKIAPPLSAEALGRGPRQRLSAEAPGMTASPPPNHQSINHLPSTTN